MTQGHTPGPWELVEAARPRIYRGEDVIATIEPDHVGKIACYRNARLIAAAPTMYDLLSAAYNALGDCEKALGGDMPRLAELRGEIRAAIARATVPPTIPANTSAVWSVEDGYIK